MQHKRFAFEFILIFISIVLFSNCKSRINRDVQTDSEYVVDILFFTKGGNSVEDKYSISKEFLKEETFVLKYKGDIFFEGNDALKDYLYEGFKERYFFITPMEKRNNLASPFHTKRDSVFLFDTKNKSLYNFNADRFLIQSFKEKYPRISTGIINELKSDGFKLNAIYYSINTDTNELFLLLEDLQTIEVIKLNIVQ